MYGGFIRRVQVTTFSDQIIDELRRARLAHLRYRANKHDCERCPVKPRCCPNAAAHNVPRSIYEEARDLALVQTETYRTSRRQRKKGRDGVRPPQTHSEA